MPDVPRQWKNPAAMLAAIAMVVGATIGVISYVKTLADDRAAAATMPIRVDLQEHKTSDERWHDQQNSRLERMERKLDRLIERR